jgi:hypothetical protein
MSGEEAFWLLNASARNSSKAITGPDSGRIAINPSKFDKPIFLRTLKG